MKNYKFIISILFGIIILHNIARIPITYIYYNVDTIGFIEAFCENIDKPELQCNGKCHLKKITQSEDKKEKTSNKIIEFNDLLLLQPKATELDFSINIVQNKDSFHYINFYETNFLENCFHPPTI